MDADVLAAIAKWPDVPAVFGWLGLTAAIGCAVIWARAEWVAAPRLERPKVVAFEADVERVETLAAKGNLRLTLAPEGG